MKTWMIPTAACALLLGWIALAPAKAQDRDGDGRYQIVSSVITLNDHVDRRAVEMPVVLRIDTMTGHTSRLYLSRDERGESDMRWDAIAD